MFGVAAILYWLLILPAVGGLAVLVVPKSQVRHPWMGGRAIALAFCSATLIVAGLAGGCMDYAVTGPQLVVKFGGLRAGVDGLSMPLVLLAAGMGFLAVWVSYGIRQGVKSYFALVQCLLVVVLGALVALEGMALLSCLLAAIIVLYFLIAGWGTERKVAAARRFLTMMLPALAAVMVAYLSGGTWVVWVMLAGFGVMMAVVPAHWWLSEVVTEACTPVALLAMGVMQTLGGYGLMRLGMPLWAQQAGEYGWIVGLIGTLTMVYGALAAMGQKQLKRMAAFVAVSLMGFFLLGMAVWTAAGVTGAAYLLVGHAVAVGMLIFIAGVIEDRVGHCQIERLGGLAGHMPAFAGWSAVGIFAAMGLPGLCVFMGELLVVMGTFARSGQAARSGVGAVDGDFVGMGVAGVGVMVLLLGCGAWTYQRVFMGLPRAEHSNLARMSVSERSILAVLGLAALGLGLMPGVVTEAIRGVLEMGMR